MSIFSTLNTGTSGLNAAQVAISTTSNNIANADNEYYTRQRVSTEASMALDVGSLSIGTGVSITTISRIHDEFVFSRLKDSSNTLSYDTFNKQTLEEVAQYFPDLDGVGLSSDIEQYFSSWNDLASNPDDASQKIALVQYATTLSANLEQTRDSVRALQDSINDQLKTNINNINDIGEQIAELNKAINKVEVLDSNNANDLRDQRDSLELTLAELLDISVFKGDMTTDNTIDTNYTDQGSEYNINIEGYSFVDGTEYHPLVISNEDNGSSYYSIYYETEGGKELDITENISGGKIGAMLDLRGSSLDSSTNGGYPSNGVLQGYIDDLDSFAQTLIVQTNNIYAQSAQESITSLDQEDLKPDMALSSYSNTINEGDFTVIMYDSDGVEVGTKTISIDLLTSMDSGTNSIVSQFNDETDDNGDNNSLNDIDDFFVASYSYDEDTGIGKLIFDEKSSNTGYTIAIEDNGTNFPGKMGLNAFFEGDSAANIGVVSDYIKDPSSLNAFSAPIDGNNEVANAMIQLQYDEVDFYRSNDTTVSETISSFYSFITTNIASDGENSGRSYETSTSLYTTVNSEFQSISGVNMDEELTDLMKYEASYSANAKVITTIDQMLDTLLGLKS